MACVLDACTCAGWEQVLEAIDENLRSPQAHIQRAAVVALRAYSRCAARQRRGQEGKEGEQRARFRAALAKDRACRCTRKGAGLERAKLTFRRPAGQAARYRTRARAPSLQCSRQYLTTPKAVARCRTHSLPHVLVAPPPPMQAVPDHARGRRPLRQVLRRICDAAAGRQRGGAARLRAGAGRAALPPAAAAGGRGAAVLFGGGVGVRWRWARCPSTCCSGRGALAIALLPSTSPTCLSLDTSFSALECLTAALPLRPVLHPPPRRVPATRLPASR